ncbi:hypothetical protein VN12_24325 [Pirellula sp. SH-Sr6A]|uniref:DUF2924 domain-containing protein n=1 Tax=Pirellula sp. SH-Sr6A TaxID=1632865 RepID=UPI00078DCA68|nr:DUF2924 domain-containing protein [Pirellula sp. SH-Sr6A]AMV35274.1 hypothetical protein VN12_24325 [Pirellula sp. SH-Sr6A]
MSPDTKKKLIELSELPMRQLVSKYEDHFGEQCRSRNRRYIYRRLAWKLQADDEGGLSERTLLRANAIAGESLFRVTPPRAKKPTMEVARPANWDKRLPPPGHVIERTYKGKTLCITVLTDGFEYDGQQYKSLTAVARAITGSHCNGFLFFKLGQSK